MIPQTLVGAVLDARFLCRPVHELVPASKLRTSDGDAVTKYTGGRALPGASP